MKKFLVKYDESNLGIAWSKGEIVEAESEEKAISKAINCNAHVRLGLDAMAKGCALYTGKSLADFENDERAYTWKATQI